MRLPARGARLSTVLCASIVAASSLTPATPVPAASTLDRTGRFAIQWWTIDDGLPEAPVNGVAFAPDGTLYCTTPTRIVCFDGDSFKPLSKALTNPVREAIGGFSNLGAAQRYTWANGGSSAPGTTVTGTVNLTTALAFTNNAAVDGTIWLGNGYGAAGTSGTWTGSITLIGVNAVPAPGAIALLGLAGLAGRRRR